VPQLRAEASVGAQRGRGAREHADDVGELASAGQRTLENGKAALGSGQLVVYLEPALLGLHGRLFLLGLTVGKYNAGGLEPDHQ
jgi:hypothetical protein